MKGFIKYILALIGNGFVFLLIGGLTVYIYLNTRFTAEPWHLVELQEEFNESRISIIPDFASYQQLEDRLFRELHEKVYQEADGPGSKFNRYRTGSMSDPASYTVNWNKSFEMPVEKPRGGVLMLHGLTDSPYSMRALAEKLHEQGFWIVALRLPGHGTIPAELTRITWKDWAAATRIGARHLRKQIGAGPPLYILGYSTGAALAVEYSLAGLDDQEISMPAGLVLLSPAIGLPPVAALAKTQLFLSELPRLEKMAWTSVMMEYDPFKYNSFPVNAGEQVYLLTQRIQSMIEKNEKNGKLKSFPRVLAFQSIVDATILPDAVIDNFMNHLPPGRESLVLFDVNMRALTVGLLVRDVEKMKTQLLQAANLPFDLELVSNSNPTSDTVQVRRKKAMQSSVEEIPLSLAWPPGIYSLSHVALPFPPDDPIYGDGQMSNVSKAIRLGRLAFYGEKGVLAIDDQQLMRLRYNPFFPYMADHIERFLAKTNEANNGND